MAQSYFLKMDKREEAGFIWLTPSQNNTKRRRKFSLISVTPKPSCRGRPFPGV
ncbi:hypothetical protein HanHA300_Chr08g0280621 [Helianthus annuus]|nr:hypothetical protein HanHA300_Chr08g0280621 [Helianthus annuus]